MLINEFTESPNLENTDLLDDLHFFMHNDPKFYRKVLYPMIAKLRDHIKAGKQCKDTVFANCVKHAMQIYLQKYNIGGNTQSVFTDTDRDELARKIFGQEMEHIHKGTYDGRKSTVKEDISQQQLYAIEQYIDQLWKHLGIDITFSRHFFDQLSRAQNKPPITAQELIQMFTKQYKEHGPEIAKLGHEEEAVMMDLLTKVNIPFIIRSNQHLKAKTILRKPNFRTFDKTFKV
jgi:hypothetical protein